MSYFHEYFLPDGKKTLVSYSKPFDLSKISADWLTSKAELFDLVEELDRSEHVDILPKLHKLRRADEIEITAGKIVEWKRR